MTKKKKKGTAAVAASAGSNRAGTSDIDLEDANDERWLARQREALEAFSKNSSSGISKADCGTASDGGAVAVEAQKCAWSASDALAKQQKLLDEIKGQKNQASNSSHSTGSGGALDEGFVVRRIPFLGRTLPVLLQNRNGPCPLLAVANGLLLRGTLNLEDDCALLSVDLLVERLSEVCRSLNAEKIANDPNVRAESEQVINLLPGLLRGLDVNCRFSSCNDFEYTRELAFFDFFGLALFHSWVADAEVANLAGSWNAVSEELAICAEIQQLAEVNNKDLSAEQGDRLATSVLLKEWLDETQTQASEMGIEELRQRVKEKEVCVFFRNNHFSTLYKHAGNLYALLTDIAFDGVEDAVWETVEINGACILDSKFQDSTKPKSKNGEQAKVDDKIVREVMAMGFSKEQAEMAAAVTNSAEAAVLMLLGEEDVGDVAEGEVIDERTCPVCRKQFKSLNGLISHRRAKEH